MRALILTADYPSPVWSGIGTAVASQAAALVALGVDVHVLAPARPCSSVVRSGTRGPVVHALSGDRCPVRPGAFDLIHLHSVGLAELAVEMRRRFRRPLVYTAHSLLARELRGVADGAAWQRCQEALMQQCDHVVFLSADEREEAVARLPTLAGRSSVLPNGVATPDPVPSAGDDVGPVVFAGRFARTKGIDLLDAVVRRLARRYRFVIAGGHGDPAEHRTVAALAAAHPEACRVVGWVDREALDRLFAGAGLVIVPSAYEPFGLVALEAMRVGAPVLAASVGGLVEAVGPGSGGRLIRSRDPDAWCDAIRELMDTPALRRALRRCGPAYVARHHDATLAARRLVEDVYQPLRGGA